MSANPFDEIKDSLAGMDRRLMEVVKRLDVLASDRVSEWETVPAAMKRRLRSRPTLLAAVARGEVERRTQTTRGGVVMSLLRVADLDRLFPARS